MLKSDGSPWRPIVHVEDIGARVPGRPRRAAREPSTTGLQRRRDVRELPDPAAGGDRRRGRSGLRGDVRRRRVTGHAQLPRLVRTFHGGHGLPAAVDGAHGRRGTLAAYRRIGVTLEEFEGPRYQRIAHVRSLIANGELDASLRAAPVPERLGTDQPASTGSRAQIAHGGVPASWRASSSSRSRSVSIEFQKPSCRYAMSRPSAASRWNGGPTRSSASPR